MTRTMLCCLVLLYASSNAQAQDWLSTAPESQKKFLAIVDQARHSYKTGKNDLQRGAARPDRAEATCGLLRGRKADKWVGKISEISTNGDGWGVMTIEIGKDVSVGTWNNSLSDISDKSLISPKSPVFRRATKMAVGDIVIFSGTFPQSDTDCIREKSLTLRGSITEPGYVIRFSELAQASQ